MSIENDDIDLGKAIFGQGTVSRKSPTDTKTCYGIAKSSSSDGKVTVDMLGLTSGESQEVEIPCTCSVQEGQRVIVTIVGTDPIVTGVAGWGDLVKADANEAKALAKAAIQAVDVEYALGESQTTPPKSGWFTTAPEWQEGKYMWQRTVTYTSEGASYSDPTCIQGAAGKNGKDGAKGDTGIGVKAVVEQYYLSTDSATQSGGSWSTNQPEWSKGKYIWTRSAVTWTDNTTTYTTPELAKAINGANETANEAVSKAEKINYYFWTDSDGAHVTTQPNDATTGPNILIDGNGFHIRQGKIEMAFFRSDEIGLGSNSQKSVIRMCGGLGEIGTVSSSSSSVLALFGELVGLKGNSGSVVGNNLANLTLTDDDAVLTASGSIVFNSKTVYLGTENLDSRVHLYSERGWIEPVASSAGDANAGINIHGKKTVGIVAGTGTPHQNDSGVYLQNETDKYEDGILALDVHKILAGRNGDAVLMTTFYDMLHNGCVEFGHSYTHDIRGWRWIKFENGFVIAVYEDEHSVRSTGNSGSFYIGDLISVPFPSTMPSMPMIYSVSGCIGEEGGKIELNGLFNLESAKAFTFRAWSWQDFATTANVRCIITGATKAF